MKFIIKFTLACARIQFLKPCDVIQSKNKKANLEEKKFKGEKLMGHRQGFYQQDIPLGGLNKGNRHSFSFSKRCTFVTCKGNCWIVLSITLLRLFQLWNVIWTLFESLKKKNNNKLQSKFLQALWAPSVHMNGKGQFCCMPEEKGSFWWQVIQL